MVKDHEEKIRVLTKPLQTSGEKKLPAFQFSNTTGKRAPRLRLLKTVSTVTVAQDLENVHELLEQPSHCQHVLMLHRKDLNHLQGA